MRKKVTHLFLLMSFLLGIAINLSAQNPCGGFVTYTQGGYGGSGAPAKYMSSHFADVFPSGLTIGCTNTLTLTNAQAVLDFLPSGTTPSGLPRSMSDPGQGYQNVLAGQLVALTLSVEFDKYDINFASATGYLGELFIAQGPYKDMTVSAFLKMANDVIGGCESGDFSAITATADAINRNFDNGTVDNGYLTCCTLSVSTVKTDVLCYGGLGTATAVTSGGVAPFTFNWVNTQETGITANLPAGTWTVIVTDALGCTATSTVTISQPNLLKLTATTAKNVSCYGGNDGVVELVAAGGTAPYTFEGATTNLAAGTYNYVVTDAHGCKANASATITEPELLVLTAIVKTNVNCFGGNEGSVELSAAGGTAPYTYIGETVNLIAGTYNYSVTDAHGCTATASATITQPELLVLTVAVKANVTCFGGNDGSVELTAVGGTTPYVFEGLTTNLAAGTYEYSVTDAHGCKAIASATITQPDLLVLSTVVLTNVKCYGGNEGSVELTAVGGTTPYIFSGDATTGLVAGTYNYLVTDAHGCTAIASATITQPDLLVLTADVKSNVSCFGGNNGSVELSAVGGTTPYVFSGDATSGLIAGTYNYLVTDEHGCTATASATITQPEKLVVEASQVNVLCHGGNNGSATLTITGGVTPYSITWTTGSTEPTITGLVAGDYSATVFDANGCSAIANVTITEPEQLAVSVDVVNVLCYGGNGSAKLTITGGVNPYTVDPAIPEQLPAGEHSGIIVDANGCSIPYVFTITQPDLLILSAATVDVSCFGGNNGVVTLTANGGTTPYTFGGDATTGLIAGTYNYTVTDAHGCFANVSATINQPTALALSITKTDVLCFGGTGTATANVTGGTAPYTYEWVGTGQNEATAELTVGTWTVIVTDAHGCSITGNVTLLLLTCDKYITVTQGGWGAKCSGNNWGCYLDSHFAAAFPYGLTIGSNGRFVKLTSTAAVHNFLPASGTPAMLAVGTLTNPTSRTLKNTLAGQVTALTLNVKFDEFYADFAPADQNLGNMIITTGKFVGWTVYDLLEEGNKALGGTSTYLLSDVNAAIDAVNQNYDGGLVDKGYLACPCVQGGGDRVRYNFNDNQEPLSSIRVYPNPIIESATITFTSNYNTNAKIDVYNISGQLVKTLFNGSVNASTEYNVSFDVNDLYKGIYVIKLVAGKDVQTAKVIIN